MTVDELAQQVSIALSKQRDETLKQLNRQRDEALAELQRSQNEMFALLTGKDLPAAGGPFPDSQRVGDGSHSISGAADAGQPA